MDQVALGDQMDALVDDVQQLRPKVIELALSLGELTRRVDMLTERAMDLHEID